MTKKKPTLIELPTHPVDALVKLAELGVIRPLPDDYLAQARAYCDEEITPAQARAERADLARSLGALGGAKSTPAKRRAVRANGKKGGRPKGSKDSYPRKRTKS